MDCWCGGEETFGDETRREKEKLTRSEDFILLVFCLVRGIEGRVDHIPSGCGRSSTLIRCGVGFGVTISLSPPAPRYWFAHLPDPLASDYVRALFHVST